MLDLSAHLRWKWHPPQGTVHAAVLLVLVLPTQSEADQLEPGLAAVDQDSHDPSAAMAPPVGLAVEGPEVRMAQVPRLGC
jgi:hypothetical protein